MGMTRWKRGNPASGASVVPALLLLLAVSVLCAALLRADAAPTLSAAPQRRQEQAYLAAVSAARLLQSAFEARDSNTFDYPEAMALLDALDHAVGQPYISRQLRLERTGLDSTDRSALNQALSAQVTLTRTDSGTVTAAITGGEFYTLSFHLPVYTLEYDTYEADEAGVPRFRETVRKTYPRAFPEALIQLEEYMDAEGYIRVPAVRQATDTGAYEGTRKWKVVWQNRDGRPFYTDNSSYTVDRPSLDDIAAHLPPPELGNPSGSAEDPKVILVYKGWNLAGDGQFTVDEAAKTITVSPDFREEVRLRIVWLTDAGDILASADYGAEETPPEDPEVPEKASDYPAFYTYQGAWETARKRTGEDGVPVTTKKPSYKLIAQRSYKVRWLQLDTLEPDILDSKTASPGKEEPRTGLVPPVMSDAESYYPFLGWDGGTMDPEAGVKMYKPIFGDPRPIQQEAVP